MLGFSVYCYGLGFNVRVYCLSLKFRVSCSGLMFIVRVYGFKLGFMVYREGVSLLNMEQLLLNIKHRW